EARLEERLLACLHLEALADLLEEIRIVIRIVVRDEQDAAIGIGQCLSRRAVAIFRRGDGPFRGGVGVEIVEIAVPARRIGKTEHAERVCLTDGCNAGREARGGSHGAVSCEAFWMENAGPGAAALSGKRKAGPKPRPSLS